MTCNKCGKPNHNAKVCRSHKAQSNKDVHELDHGIDALFLGTVDMDQLDSKVEKSWFSQVCENNVAVEFKLDTDAQANVLPLKIFMSMKGKTKHKATSEARANKNSVGGIWRDETKA